MVKVVYEVVPHDGGWAYKLGDVYSEAFPSHSEALEARAGFGSRAASFRERTGLPGDPSASRHPVHDRELRLSRARSRSHPPHTGSGLDLCLAPAD